MGTLLLHKAADFLEPRNTSHPEYSFVLAFLTVNTPARLLALEMKRLFRCFYCLVAFCLVLTAASAAVEETRTLRQNVVALTRVDNQAPGLKKLVLEAYDCLAAQNGTNAAYHEAVAGNKLSQGFLQAGIALLSLVASLVSFIHTRLVKRTKRANCCFRGLSRIVIVLLSFVFLAICAMVLAYSHRRLYKEEMTRVDISAKYIDCVGKALNLSDSEISLAQDKAGTTVDAILEVIRRGSIQLLSGFGFVLKAVVIFLLAKSLPKDFKWPKLSKHRAIFLVLFVILFALASVITAYITTRVVINRRSSGSGSFRGCKVVGPPKAKRLICEAKDVVASLGSDIDLPGFSRACRMKQSAFEERLELDNSEKPPPCFEENGEVSLDNDNLLLFALAFVKAVFIGYPLERPKLITAVVTNVTRGLVDLAVAYFSSTFAARGKHKRLLWFVLVCHILLTWFSSGLMASINTERNATKLGASASNCGCSLILDVVWSYKPEDNAVDKSWEASTTAGPAFEEQVVFWGLRVWDSLGNLWEGIDSYLIPIVWVSYGLKAALVDRHIWAEEEEFKNSPLEEGPENPPLQLAP